MQDVHVKLNPGFPCKSSIQRAEDYFIFVSKLDLNLKNELIKVCILSTALYGAEAWTLGKVVQKYLESFEMWGWRRMEISWTDRVKSKEVLHRVKEERNVIHAVKRRKATWTGHILRRNCRLNHVIEGKIEGIGRQGRYVSGYWLTLRKREDTGNWKRQQLIDLLFAFHALVSQTVWWCV